MHYTEHLSKDKKLKSLIDEQGPLQLDKKRSIFMDLCRSIMSQQLSTQVAKVIHQRFLNLYGGKEPTAEQITATTHEALRGIGLSNAKSNYVRNVAHFHLEQGIDKNKLSKLSNEDVIAYLTQIKGVGRWTAEMLLMFTLAREDVFAVDDLGIQTGMIKLYKLDSSDKKLFREKMLKISAKWSPYRTYACMHLWRYKDIKKPTEKKK